MAQPIARDAEDFARLMLRTVARLGERGDWVPARDAYERTVAEHPDHAYLGHIAAKPGRRIGLSAITERLRAAEFPDIERRKAGARQNAPVLYRVGPAPVTLDLQLPQRRPAQSPAGRQAPHGRGAERECELGAARRADRTRGALALAAPAAAARDRRRAGRRERAARAAPLVAARAAGARQQRFAGHRERGPHAAPLVAAAARARPDARRRPGQTLGARRDASRAGLDPASSASDAAMTGNPDRSDRRPTWIRRSPRMTIRVGADPRAAASGRADAPADREPRRCGRSPRTAPRLARHPKIPESTGAKDRIARCSVSPPAMDFV